MEYRCLHHIIDLKTAHDAQQNQSQRHQQDRVEGDKENIAATYRNSSPC